jgi:predicted enzyme related to lactoylglutathione lyase
MQDRSAANTPKLAALWALALFAVGVSAAEPGERYWPPIVDPPTHQYTPGRWVWGDLVTTDVARAAEFYGKVFGWTFETYGGSDDLDTYTLALANGVPIGGMVFDKRAVKGHKPSARWIGLASVPDVAVATEAVTKNGGKVVLAPVGLGERGETAVFTDPEGAVFGVVRSKNGDPLDYVGDLNEWVWLDLWAAEVDKEAQFYRAVVGYDALPLEQGGPRRGVQLVSNGYLRAGIMQKQDARITSVWLPYIRVADAAKTADAAKSAGGSVLYAPSQLNRAIVGIIADPNGAPVGIAQLPATIEAQP